MSSQTNFLSAMENWVNIYLSRALSEYFDYLKTTGISMQQAFTLTIIHYNEPCKISDICEHMMVSAPAVSQMADRLEMANLVQRIPEPGDRRVRNVVLTKQGRDFIRESIKARQNWVNKIPIELSDEQFDQISHALQILVSIYKE